MTLRIALLGPPEVEVAGRPLVVDTRKAVAVLAYLVCASGPVPRDMLGFLLWPDSAADRSRAALRRTLSSLRKGLGPGALVTDRTTATLAIPAECVIDVDRFEAYVREDGDSPARAMEAWQKAIDLYRGEFMAGFAIRNSPEFDDWQRSQAGHFRRLAATTLDRLAKTRAEHGMFEGAVDAAARRLELDALHEPAHRRLMMFHAIAGDRPSAIRQYRDCVQILDEELGVPPLDETTDLYRKILEGSVQVIAEPETNLQRKAAGREPTLRPGLAGRDGQMASLTAAYRAAAGGMSVVAIRGEAGIGKSRLLEEFIGSLDAGVRVARIVSHQGEAAIPHGATIELLRSGLRAADGQLSDIAAGSVAEAGRLVPELLAHGGAVQDPPPLDSPGGYQRLLEGSARVLLGMTKGEGPGVLQLDDAHWADEDSLRLLGMLASRLHEEPVFVAIAYRHSEVAADHPLAPVLRDAQRSGILTTVDLGRLERGDVAELVERHVPEHSEVAAEVFQLSEGVPLFVVEYLALLSSEGHLGAVPMGVRDLLTDLVARRSELGRQVLDAAAVIGRSFDFMTLLEAVGRTDEETIQGLEELMQAGLVREIPDVGSFDFDHDHIRRLIYESMRLVRRRLLHGRVADSLRDRLTASDGGLGAAPVAGHLQAAGRDGEAAEQHFAAAEGAARLYANDQALHHYEAALALGYQDTARVREVIGDLHALAGRYGQALANLQAAAASCEGPQRAALERKRGVVYTRAGDWELAEAAFTAASQGLEDDGAARSHLLTDWAWLAHRRGDDPRSRELAERALIETSDLEDPVAIAQAHNVMGIVERRRKPEAAVAHHEQSRRLAADVDQTAHAAALNNLALSNLALGEPDAGLEFAEQALAISERLGDRHKAAAVHSNIADLLHALGRDEEAMSHLRLSAGAFADVGKAGEHLEPEIWKLTEW